VIQNILQSRLQQGVAAVVPEVDIASVQLRPCADPQFGDYQSNALIAIAKRRKLNPRQLATEVVARIDVADWCEPIGIAGPGFLNFRLKPSALAAALAGAVRGDHLFFQPATEPAQVRTYVVDFSSPNVAKPMHVGHIRSTGIGDCIQRVLRLLGHRVITDNHIGDWGTQFGKLLVGWKELLDRDALARDPIAEMERLYKAVNSQTESDPGRLEQARQELVKLQAGDPDNLAIWQEMIRLSQVQFDTIYGRLGIRFDHTLGESFYNPWLGEVVEDLLQRGLARESAGAIGVFSDGSLPPAEDPFLVNRDGEWVADPALVRKSDGGFNYMTTDLATIAYRLKTWAPDEIVYVVDDRQAPHFRKLFLTFQRWRPEAAQRVRLRHVGFGKILGEDGKPYKTRSGDTIKLADLLDEAEERAREVVREKQSERKESERVPESQWAAIARVVGISAVKYADLLPNRQSDYVFNWEKMLSFNGNTAPYLLYAYTRTRGVLRKAEAEGIHLQALATQDIELVAAEELSLARHLLNYGFTLAAVADDYRPNYLCNYLFDLAGRYSQFYEACPVLKAEGATRTSRLALCDATSRVLKQGLRVLGIETLEQM
jgi:arginyl-tRNA synthetase